MAAHAELGGSSAARWIACPGSVRLSRQAPPQPESVYAAEGTVAHALGEQAIASASSPRGYIGTHPLPEQYPGIAVDEDMAEAVEVYVDEVRELIDQAGTRWKLEQKVDVVRGLEAVGRNPPDGVPMFGTADFMALIDDARTLVVFDYKHGAGVPVDVEGNLQLRYYALGAYGGLSKKARAKVREVAIGICQPRAPHRDGPVRWERFQVDDLIQFSQVVNEAAWTATQDDEAPLAAGSHCRWCPAAGFCPELQRANVEKAKMAFSEDTGRIRPDKEPEELSAEELRVILDSASDIEAWLKRVREHAQHLIQSEQVDSDQIGYKLVPKRAQRKWAADQETVAARLTEAFGLGADELYETKLRTPAQLEKTIGKEELKQAKDEFNELVKKESSGFTLAPATDPRADQGTGQKSAKQAFLD